MFRVPQMGRAKKAPRVDPRAGWGHSGALGCATQAAVAEDGSGAWGGTTALIGKIRPGASGARSESIGMKPLNGRSFLAPVFTFLLPLEAVVGRSL